MKQFKRGQTTTCPSSLEALKKIYL